MSFLLGIFALNVLVTAKFFCSLCWSKRFPYKWLEWAGGIVACFLVVWMAFDIVALAPRFAQGLAFPMIGFVAVLFAVLASTMYMRLAELSFARKEYWRYPAVWLALVLSSGTTAWSAQRFYSSTHVVSYTEQMADLAPPGYLSEEQEFVAITDRGRHVPLKNWVVDPLEFQSFDFQHLYSQLNYVGSAITRASPDPSANCHGWVFTGGLFHLTGQGVEMVLEDNGYVVVEAPKADDIIIYRSTGGDIVHTGLIRGVLDDGTVIVESKWSVSGRFLHNPTEQPYSQTFSYYRSPRKWHYVTIVPASSLRDDAQIASSTAE